MRTRKPILTCHMAAVSTGLPELPSKLARLGVSGASQEGQ